MPNDAYGITCVASNSLAGNSAASTRSVDLSLISSVSLGRLVIELDGGQHADACGYDVHRTRLIVAEGYRVVRFWNDDVLLRMNAVLADVLRHLGEM